MNYETRINIVNFHWLNTLGYKEHEILQEHEYIFNVM